MKVKLPIVVNLNDEEQRNYYTILNKFIKFDENEKPIVDIEMMNKTGIKLLENDIVGMLKIGNDFRNYGSNGVSSSDYIYFFNTSIKFTNDDIVKSFLESFRNEFKSIKNVETHIKESLYIKYTKGINLEKIIQELETEIPFLNIPKSKMKIR